MDVIVALDNSAIRAAQRATSKIPIVMVSASDPVGNGFVRSLRQPGGNITGVAWDQAVEIMGRYPQLLKELVPGLTRIGAVVDPGLTGVTAYVEAAREAARKLGMTLLAVDVRKPDDLEPAFAQLASWGAQAVFVFGSPMIFGRFSSSLATPNWRVRSDTSGSRSMTPWRSPSKRRCNLIDRVATASGRRSWSGHDRS